MNKNIRAWRLEGECYVYKSSTNMTLIFLTGIFTIGNIKQARKLGRCDSYLQSETINDSLTHSLTDRGNCYRI